MNLILCFALMCGVFSGIGLNGATTTLESVAPCLTTDGQATDCDAPGAITGPAAAAGLAAGDRITAWDGRATRTWDDVLLAIRDSDTGPTDITVDRDGQALSFTLTPVTVEAVDTDGTPLRRSMVGITSAYGRVREPITAVPGIVWDQITASVGLYARLPVTVWDTAKQTVEGEARGADSPMSVVGIARMTGEVSEAAADTGDAWTTRIALWLYIGAALNLALWLFNLIPLLPLDGGHVLGAAIEGVRRTWARVRRRRPLPGAIDLARAIPFTYVVFALLIIMSVVLVVADLINPVTAT
jgi:membrane-associated protease RseP (regulator of RpoE activity)